MRISILSITPEDFVINKEYDFKIDSKYQGKFKVIRIKDKKVTMELDELASSAYKQFIDKSYKEDRHEKRCDCSICL